MNEAVPACFEAVGIAKFGMVEVRNQVVDDVLLECYSYPPGPAQQTGRHAHAEYQVCLSWNVDGEYWYRGSYRSVPSGSVSILHPGEVHSSRDLSPRLLTSAFSLFYFPISLINDVLRREEARCRNSEPYFRECVSPDKDTFNALARVDLVWRNPASTMLERQSAFYDALVRLLVSHRHLAVLEPESRAWGRPGVERAREYLQENYLSEVSFAKLVAVSGLSAFHLARCFRTEVGLPPHRYQIQLRIGLAQKLIAKGHSLSEAATIAGFADQSHLGRHFKKLVRLSPGRYRGATKRFQDALRGRLDVRG